MKRGIIILVGVLGLVALLVASSVGAFPPERPLAQGGAPTLVSYQGLVKVDGTAFNGTGQFKFAIVNGAGDTTYWSNDGTSVGGSEPTAHVELSVADGLFNVLLGDTSLDGMSETLSASVFSDTDRYLRVWFNDGSTGFQQLSPDQRMASVPYALQAQEAVNADTVDGQDSSAFASATHDHDATYQGKYVRTVVASPVPGDPVASGTALLNALAGITDASASNPYLLRIEPGVYDLGTSALTMKEYVDIEGSGELVTKITAAGSASGMTGTVVGADNAELRFLTVENTGGDTQAIAIYNSSASPRLTHVTATALGANVSYGVRNDSSSPTMTNVTATASGGSTSCGVFNQSSSSTMTNVTATASEGTMHNYGILNSTDGGSYTVKVDNSRIAGTTWTIWNCTGFTTLVGASLLDGGPVAEGGGTVTCAGVYDEDYVFYPSDCPP